MDKRFNDRGSKNIKKQKNNDWSNFFKIYAEEQNPNMNHSHKKLDVPLNSKK